MCFLSLDFLVSNVSTSADFHGILGPSKWLLNVVASLHVGCLLILVICKPLKLESAPWSPDSGFNMLKPLSICKSFSQKIDDLTLHNTPIQQTLLLVWDKTRSAALSIVEVVQQQESPIRHPVSGIFCSCTAFYSVSVWQCVLILLIHT